MALNNVPRVSNASDIRRLVISPRMEVLFSDDHALDVLGSAN